MRLRRVGLILFALLVVLGAGAATLFWAVRKPPDFYQREMARDVAPAVRRAEAESFVQRTERLAETVRNDGEWSERFEQDQVNSWIAEEWSGRFGAHVPPGVSDPRVLFAPGRMELAFRYRRENVVGVVSVSLRPTIRGPNRLGIEIDAVRAGLVPLPLDQILERLVAAATERGWTIERHNVDGRPVFEVVLSPWMPEGAVLTAVEPAERILRVRGVREIPPTPGEEPAFSHRTVDHSAAAGSSATR